MTIKIVNSVKYIGLSALLLFSIIACERDFENIGVGLVDNNQFETKDSIFEVIAYNKNIEASLVNQDNPATRDLDGLTQYLLGIYKSNNFGLLKTSFITQIGLPSSTKFGDEVSIDTVILNIPYYAKKLVKNADGTPNFRLDSILGNRDAAYTLSVYRSGTFLNALDPSDPTKPKKYFSDENYTKETMLYSGTFKPNKNDTALYVKRRTLNNDIDVDDIDTIKTEAASPSIKLPLNESFFKNTFIDQQDNGIFDSFDVFSNYFRGIIIEADGADGSLMTLAMANATITIYYTNTILKNESGTDLNDNGTTDDTDVPIRTKQKMAFPFTGLRASKYVKDNTGSELSAALSNQNTAIGEKKLFVQGAAGSMAIIELFKDVDLDAIRDKNWLINEANLVFYIDETTVDSVPARLQLYNLDYNSQLIDVFTEAQISGIGGFLERENVHNKPLKYKFRITDYISDVLKSEDPIELKKLALKVFHPTDVPSSTIVNDTLNKDFSWRAKGVVLKGNEYMSSDAGFNKRVKLEISYTIDKE